MSTNVGSVVSHFPSPQNGFTTTLASTITSGATTVPLNSVTGYSNGQVFVGVVEPTSVTNKQTFTGIVDTAGVQLTSVVWTAGTNMTHNAGSTVVDYVSATHIAMMIKGLLTSLDQDGTLKAGAVDNAAVLAANVVTTAAIAANSVVTASIAAGIQLPDKMKNPYKFSVYCNAAINSGNGAFALTKFDTKLFDTGANYSTSTGLFTAPIAGFYLFSWLVEVEVPNNQLITSLYKNGADYTRAPNFNITNTNATSSGITKLLQLAANDTIGIYTYCDTTRVISVGSSPTKTNFDGFLVSAT